MVFGGFVGSAGLHMQFTINGPFCLSSLVRGQRESQTSQDAPNLLLTKSNKHPACLKRNFISSGGVSLLHQTVLGSTNPLAGKDAWVFISTRVSLALPDFIQGSAKLEAATRRFPRIDSWESPSPRPAVAGRC